MGDREPAVKHARVTKTLIPAASCVRKKDPPWLGPLTLLGPGYYNLPVVVVRDSLHHSDLCYVKNCCSFRTFLHARCRHFLNNKKQLRPLTLHALKQFLHKTGFLQSFKHCFGSAFIIFADPDPHIRLGLHLDSNPYPFDSKFNVGKCPIRVLLSAILQA